MVHYIIKSAEDITVSIIANNKLVCHRKIDNICEVAYLLKDISVDKVTFIMQGTQVDEITEDSYVLSSFYINDNSVYFAVADRDIVFLTELCKSVNVKEMNIVSYLDYITYKFRYFKKSIVVDNYLDGYAVMYLENGKVMDFMKASRERLIETISVMKSIRDAPVKNAKLPISYDLLEDSPDIILMSKLLNVDQLKEGIFFSMEHLPFILSNNFRNLLQESEIDDGSSLFDTNSENGKAENLKQPKTKQKKKKSNVDYLFETESLEMNKKDKIFNVFLLALIVVCLVGIGINYMYKGMILDTQTSVDSSEVRVKSVGDLNSILDGDNSKSPISKLALLYLKSNNLRIASTSYDYGELSVVLLSKDKSDLKIQEDILSKSYVLKETSVVGAFVEGDNTYEKTKIVLEPINTDR